MVVAVLYGFLFTLLQGYEYGVLAFSVSDSFLGSSFFITTGFHGVHVLVGSIFLIATLSRVQTFSSRHSIGLECSLWY